MVPGEEVTTAEEPIVTISASLIFKLSPPASGDAVPIVSEEELDIGKSLSSLPPLA